MSCVQQGSTALIAAAVMGHLDCVRLLIDEGADKEAKNKVRVRVGRFRRLFDHVVATLLLSFVILVVFCCRAFKTVSFLCNLLLLSMLRCCLTFNV